MAQVTLTFDNGPDPLATPLVLDCLAQHGVKSTFFVLGQNVSASAGLDLARRARREGHWIGNHTWSHTGRLGEMTREAALEEFDRTQQALAWLEQPVRLFRPRGGGGRLGKGLLNPAIVERLTAGGFTCVLWTSVPGDFRDPDGWVDRALADCRSRDWSLVVLHDIRNGAVKHLNSFLRKLAAEGHSFTQEFPPDCTPIVTGRVLQPLDQFC
ncbi:MAG TPA: polysaccharide deacetylase family protein [Bryobacteraceae bacterium]|nr:polysaccharide deacetylase family protein [Bryobacteraceae bacterium]